MAKRKRDRQEVKPTATNVDWPVFVPNSDGTVSIEVGRARLRYGTLVVEFKDSGPSDAIQNMIARGVILGFDIRMLKTDAANKAYQNLVKDEEAISEAVAKGVNSGLLRFNEEGKLEATAEGQTPEEVVQVLLNLDQIVVEPPVEKNEFTIVSQGDELDNILNITTNDEEKN